MVWNKHYMNDMTIYWSALLYIILLLSLLVVIDPVSIVISILNHHFIVIVVRSINLFFFVILTCVIMCCFVVLNLCKWNFWCTLFPRLFHVKYRPKNYNAMVVLNLRNDTALLFRTCITSSCNSCSLKSENKEYDTEIVVLGWKNSSSSSIAVAEIK